MPKAQVSRVLFLAKYLDSGGVTTHMMTLARELQARGIEVGLISAGAFGDHAMTPEWFEASGVRHFTVNYASRNPLELIQAARATLRAVREFKPDLLHVHWRVTSPYAQLVQMVLGIPFVTTLHLLGIGEGIFHRAISFWGRQTIAISSETRNYLRTEFRVPESQLHTIYNGADSSRFRLPSVVERADARAQFELTNECVAISLIGRLEEVKGHALLIDAIAPLVQSGVNIHLLFAGQGALHDALVSRVANLGLSDRVTFLGHTDTRAVLWASDISVLPSYKEGFPLTTVEAMLCGVAHIRTATSGAHDVITNGVDGFVIPVGDVEQLRKRIGELIDSAHMRADFVRIAHERATQQLTATHMAEATLDVYRLALTN